MKKPKIFILLFCISFIMGGTNIINAYTQTKSLKGLKADFLGQPHYIPDVIGRNGGKEEEGMTKTTFSIQKVNATIKDDRSVLFAVTDENGGVASGNNWQSILGTTDGYAELGNPNGQISAPTSMTGLKFAAASKLALPWTQAEFSSGTWVIDD